MQKEAIASGLLWHGLKSLVTKGTWHTMDAMGRMAARNGNSGMLPGLMRGVAGTMRSTPGKALGYYGMAGMAAPLMGINLPGSGLALSATMPGLSLLDGAANMIRAGRTAAMPDAVKADAERGARAAASDFTSVASMQPDALQSADAYRKFMTANGINMSGADGYLHGMPPKGMSAFSKLEAAASDPDRLVKNMVRTRIAQQVAKSAGFGSVAKTVLSGAGKLMPWAFAAAGVGGVANAALSKKPYDAEAVAQEGYSGTQAAIEKKLAGMSPMERMAAGIDPTLAVSRMEEQLPGTISNWEKQTGRKFTPGWLNSTMANWKSGGKPQYYEYDAYDNRKYL